ncbi:DUF4265 domain-containing protein [Streptomyces sp. NPDC008001]|uniref:DUF4265 domain-containing protein n=1 Tax=Streptomyces sp. NPDC008001 TaxID=3364804 RepID=UPI0036EDD4B5
MTAGSSVVHIHLKREGDWPPVAYEEISAAPLGSHRFRLTRPPLFAKRLAAGDTVRVVHLGNPELPWVEEVMEWGGHSTVRVIVLEKNGTSGEQRLQESVSALGMTADRTRFDGLFVIDVPADVDYAELRAVLDEGESHGLWEYEEGAVSAQHDSQL